MYSFDIPDVDHSVRRLTSLDTLAELDERRWTRYQPEEPCIRYDYDARRFIRPDGRRDRTA
jgi:hypothetical protein